MNKIGLIRIVEASIAIVIIMGVLFTFFVQSRIPDEPDLSEQARDILEEISKNAVLREEILAYDPLEDIPVDINNFVSDRIPSILLKFEVRICEVDDVCGKSTYTPVSIFVGERIISSTITNPVFQPKKVKLFIWQE